MKRERRKLGINRRALSFVLILALLVGLAPASSLALTETGKNDVTIGTETGQVEVSEPTGDSSVPAPSIKDGMVEEGTGEDKIPEEPSTGEPENASGEIQDEITEDGTTDQNPSDRDELIPDQTIPDILTPELPEIVDNQPIFLTTPVTFDSLLLAAKTTREAMDISKEVLKLKSTLKLNGNEISNGAVIPEKDLIDGIVTVNFEFDLPTGQVRYDETGETVEFCGTPIPGDQIYFELPELFNSVGDEAIEPIDFVVYANENGIKAITIGAVNWEGNRLVLTFNDAMENQSGWQSLEQCYISAQVGYKRNPDDGEPGKIEVKAFDKTFTIEKEDGLAKTYQLQKTVVNWEDKKELGTDVTYSKLQNRNQQGSSLEKPNPGAIASDGSIVWKVVVTPQEDAALNGMSLLEVPDAHHTIEGITCEIDGKTSGVGVWDAEEMIWTFPEGGTQLTGAATFLITTKIKPEFWYLQADAGWKGQTKVTNEVKLKSAASQVGGVRELLSAEASVSYARQMVVKYGTNNWKNNTQSWTIDVNRAGHLVKNAYVVDQLNKNMELRGTEPILVDGVSIPAITSQEAIERKTPGYWTEPFKDGSTQITIYLGDITKLVSIKIATKTKESVVNGSGDYTLRNDAQLFGDFEGTVGKEYGTDYDELKHDKPGLTKTGRYDGETDRLHWTVKAVSNYNVWIDAYLVDFVVPGSKLSLSEEQWGAFEKAMTETMSVATGAAAHIVEVHQKDSTLAALQQQLPEDFAKSIAVTGMEGAAPAEGVFYGTIKMDGTVQIATVGAVEETSAYFILAKIPEKESNKKNVTLSFDTKPVQMKGADKNTHWRNWASLYRDGDFIVKAKADADTGKGKDYISKTTEGYDYETHRASWLININPKGLSWADYLPVTSTAAVTDQLPKGWRFEQVELVDAAGNVSTVAGVTADPDTNEISWEIPEEIRSGNAHLTYRVIASIEEPEEYLTQETIKVTNQAELWLDGVSKDRASCEFTIENHGPQKFAKADGEQQIKWTIQVNEGYYPYANARVEDDLPEGLTPIFESAFEEALCPKVEAWYLVHDSKGKAIKGTTAAVTASYNSQSNTITINLPEPGKGYWLEFATQIYGPIADSYHNTARFIGDGKTESSDTASIDRAQINASGGIAVRVGTITITKTDDATGRKIDGAVFRLIGTKGSSYIQETVAINGIAKFENLPFGEYQLKEVQAAPGYQINEEFNAEYQSFSMGHLDETGQLGMKLECPNRRSAFAMSFLKRDGDTGRALSGVEFALFDNQAGTGEPMRVGASNAYGYVSFTDLAAGTYYLYETKPLPGYAPRPESLCKAVIDSEGNVSYTDADGNAFQEDFMFNGVAPILTNHKDAVEIINGVKYLSGRSLNSGEFTFALIRESDQKEIGTVSNGADGRFRFRLIFTAADAGTEKDPKTHKYRIVEKAGNLSGVTYDQTSYTYQVNVWVDDQGNIRITDASLSLDGFAGSAGASGGALTVAAFHNSYTSDHKDPDRDQDKHKDHDKDTKPSGDPEDETIIPDEEVPLGPIPGEDVGDSAETIIIAEEEVPLGGVTFEEESKGRLPKTGLAVGTAEQFFLLGLALIALGLGLRFRKKNEE